MLSLRAEYTRLIYQKNILSTRGTRDGNGFRSCSREKGARYRVRVNVDSPCAQLSLWSSWLKRLAVNRLAAGSTPVSVATFFVFVFYVHGENHAITCAALCAGNLWSNAFTNYVRGASVITSCANSYFHFLIDLNKKPNKNQIYYYYYYHTPPQSRELETQASFLSFFFLYLILYHFIH